MDPADLSELLKTLSDENRLRILNLLSLGPLCVCDLEKGLDLHQSNLSRHLGKLKTAELITSEKKGLFTYYSLGKRATAALKALSDLSGGFKHPNWEKDKSRLDRFLQTKVEKC